MPQRFILEKQPGGEGHTHDGCLGKLRRIEVEIREARERVQFMPFVILMTGRHECELAREIPERRSRQPFDERLPVASRATLVHHEQVHRRVEAVFDSATARGLNGFGRHAMACNGAALDEIGRTNLYGGMRDDLLDASGRQKHPIICAGICAGFFEAAVHREDSARRSAPALGETN